MSTVWKAVSLITLVAVLGTLALVVYAGTPAATAQTAPAPTGAEERVITVVAQGQVKVKPDVAYVNLGVRTTAPTAKEAMAQNNATIASVIARLEALGVAKKDMQTGNLSLYPQTRLIKEDDPSTEKIVAYWASNTLNVAFGDLARVGEILDAAIAAGANSISGIRFGIRDDSKLRDEALTLALKNARATADLAAQGLSLKVSGVQNVSVESYGSSVPVYAGDMAAAKGLEAAVPVEAGEVTVTASVRVTFTF
jgi:hypothetical protein